MIRKNDSRLYGLKIAKAIIVLNADDAEGMDTIEDERLDLEGKKAVLLYDRAHRNTNWFILDLSTRM